MFLILTVLLGLAFASFAGDTNTSLFNGNELGVSAATFYQPKTSYSLNAEARASYFLTRNFGLEANLPFYSQNAIAVSEVGLNALARLPLQVSVFKQSVGIAPYLGVGTTYQWNTKTFTYDGKFGTEGRITSKWSIFAEGQYKFDHWTSTEIKQGTLGGAGGLRLIL